ncbi:FliM/FliN family flagellar motor switch protein [Photobacterium toruni]|uniref:FliM/FliN family flagellar motor switch protein n=1 Tax=Photobacterium toruni TaxID=1935446 RepID=UPI0021102BEA|nr:FliM/FliN family flagellar motor C-terminal domain-containing protein [Photobacterium toruni]
MDSNLSNESIEQSLKDVQEMSSPNMYETFSEDSDTSIYQPTSAVKLPDVKLNISVQAGSATMHISDITKLTTGDLITLDTDEHASFPIMVQDTLFAYGVIVKHDKKYAVKITEMVNVSN